MTKAGAGELLELLIKQAPKLRDAGVARVDLDGFSFTLRAKEPEAVQTDNATEEGPSDALHDRDTFGGRAVPGRARRDSPQ